MRKIVTALAAAAVAAGTLAVAPAATAVQPQGPDYAPPPIKWGPCSAPGLAKAGAECGFLVVPMDYAQPSGPTVQIAVSRVKHKTAKYQGVLLVNPGGPGGSGLGLSVLGRNVPQHAGDSYDWIGFDPRGVGSSEPALACDGNYFAPGRPAYVPKTPQLESTWRARAKGYAEACAKNGPLLQHIKTTDVAHDMDSLRKALGQQQINYYGFSYGTYLGQVYSTLYPDRMRRMVLDGNVDPRKVWYDANLDQDVAFDRNIRIYFDWLAKYDNVYHLGKTGSAVEQLWYAQQRKLDRDPAGGVIGGDEWTDIFLQAGYYVFGWEDMAKAFDGWVHRGDWQTLKALYEKSNAPGDDNGYAVYNAVQCTDAQWPQDWDRWRHDAWATHTRAPFETWSNTWYNATCLNWPAKAGKPVDIDGSKASGALLISEELDAATPYSGSLEVRKRYPRSSLISAPGGTTHAGSLSGVSCVDDKVADYLATGALPKRVRGDRSDVQCAPVPQPVPSPVASGAQQKADAQAKAAAEEKQGLLAGLLRF